MAHAAFFAIPGATAVDAELEKGANDLRIALEIGGNPRGSADGELAIPTAKTKRIGPIRSARIPTNGLGSYAKTEDAWFLPRAAVTPSLSFGKSLTL